MSPRLLEPAEVTRRTTWSRSEIYRRVRDGTFPAPIQIGSHQKLVWVEAEVDAWIEEQIRTAPRVRATAGSGR